MTSIHGGFANLIAHQRPIVGDLKMSIVGVDHLGWLICDGRSLDVNEFLFLFNVIGYHFGGSGSNFNLPNPAGQVAGVLGTYNDGFTTQTLALGDQIGEFNHLLTLAEIPSHNHGSNTGLAGSHDHGGSTGLAGSHDHGGNTSLAGSHNHGGTTSTAGSHTHTTNANGGQNDFGLCTADGTNTATGTDSSQGELNLWTVPTALVVNSNGDHNHGITTEPNHQHTITTQADHQHTITTQAAHQHTITAEGGGLFHNNMPPTIALGNYFIYSGLPTYPTLFKQSFNGWPGFYLGDPPLQ